MKNSLVKPFILLTLIVSLFIVSSCEKSEEIVEADLIGTWDMGQASVDVKVGPVSLFNFLKTTLMFGDDEAQALVDQLTAEYLEMGGGSVTFNADYSYLVLQNQMEESGTWKLEGDKLYLTMTGEILDDKPMNVESLDASAALVSWEEDHEFVPADGMDSITATIIIELNLSKQQEAN